MVTQDTSLLHRSIRDNLLYGRPDATEEQLRVAVAKARAEAFIDSLVDGQGRRGYDAHVGERGVKLSGGQRQRIAIARVLLKDAPILVLDEATSALDSEVEAAIQDSLDELMGDKTVIAIAHRLSTIARMDRLVVMDQGRIVETGSHAELIAQWWPVRAPVGAADRWFRGYRLRGRSPFLRKGSDPGVLLETCMIRALCSLFLLIALAVSTATAMAAPVADEQLQQVILLSRHNLRAPVVASGALAKATPETWQRWDVAPGELTTKGGVLEVYMGRYIGQWLRQAQLLPASGCPQPVDFHAHANSLQRTQATAQFFVAGAFPGCPAAVEQRTPLGTMDPLFDPVIHNGDPASAPARWRQCRTRWRQRIWPRHFPWWRKSPVTRSRRPVRGAATVIWCLRYLLQCGAGQGASRLRFTGTGQRAG